MALKNRNSPLCIYASDLIDFNDAQGNIAALVLDFKALFGDLTDEQILKHLSAIINDNGEFNEQRINRRNEFALFETNYKNLIP